LDLKDKIIYEPFVGAGAMFLPLKNKGAILIGSDVDLEALSICKQLVPEAILIHHDTLGCLEPNRNIKYFQKKIKAIQEKSQKTKKQFAKNTEEIERLEKLIEKEKQRTPWR
jgi:site-specific DNA-adenine methylase